MLEIHNILCPTDLSACAGHALPHAVRLAGLCRADLHLVNALVVHEADPGNAAHRLPNMDHLYEALERHAQAQMQSVMDEHGDAGFRIKSAQVRSLSAAGAILDYAGENDVDLIVMGTHCRRGMRRLLLGSVAEQVVRLAPCPVLTVPQGAEAGPASQVDRILVPVDFSDYAKLALGYAAELTSLFEAEMHLLHIVDEVVYPDFYPPVMPSGGSVSDELRDQSLARLKDLLAEAPASGTPAHVHVRSGRAATAIADFAAELRADLIVLASHGLTGLSHILLGSVSENVVRRAPCSVFTVKSFGKTLVGD
jgi:nucleotide-binding universal stress UspA family protein